MRTTDLALVLCAFFIAAFPGCSTVESQKFVIFEKDSINLHPVPYSLVEVDGQAEAPGEMVLPDGTYFKISGSGSANNLTLVNTQNDGTSQTSRGQVDAEVSPTVTGQGNAESTDTDSGVMEGDGE